MRDRKTIWFGLIEPLGSQRMGGGRNFDAPKPQIDRIPDHEVSKACAATGPRFSCGIWSANYHQNVSALKVRVRRLLFLGDGALT